MKKQWLYKILILVISLTLMAAGQSSSAASAMPSLSTNSKVLIPGRAIATWPSAIPVGEKRPVVVFLPGWGGAGAVTASVTAQNMNLVNEGYVTLAIGFDDLGNWTSNIDAQAAAGLDALCADASIPANCNAIVVDGESYGGAQNYWVMEYLRAHGYDSGAGSTGNAFGFLSEDAGYSAPGTLTDPTTGAFTRTGLADTSAYSVAMIENLGDATFPVDECTWGNCGARELSNAHLARGDANVFSICPPGGDHGTRGYVHWDAWVISAIKTMIHVTHGIPTFTGYTNPTQPVGNTCVNTPTLPGLSVSGINIVANGQPIRLRGVNMGDPFWARGWYGSMYSTADYANLSQNWHANVVRISIFPTQWKNMDHATLLAGLAQEVNAALANGMYVIISYHVIGWPDGWYQPAYPGNPADTYDSSMSVATSFWAQIAQTYGSDTRIIFDLWNEPAFDSSDWVGADPNPYWPILKVYYETLIQTVRSNSGQNIVLATGNRWASWLVGIKDNPLADPNVVYAYHKYSVVGSNTAAEWDKDTGGLIGIKPVMVSEWGYEDSDVTNPTWPGSQASYGIPFTQWMDGNNLSNLAWMYHHDWTPALLKADGSLTLYGTFVKQYLGPKPYPVVTSSLRANSNPTSAASVDFTVIFSTPVTGVDINDFVFTASPGITGESVTTVTPVSTSIYTVSVNTGSGNGTLRLDVLDNDSIQDTAGNPLGGVGTGNGNFTSGESYLVIKTPSFADVPSAYWSWGFIERLYNAGITAGCGTNPLIYCPNNTVTRAEMALFLLRGEHGSGYVPPAVGDSTGFTDVVPTYWAATWIKQLYAEGITAGCGPGIYCPDSTVTRAQMAVFLLRGEHGSAYMPPAVGTGTGFSDVAPTDFAAAWIKQLYAEGITSGCGAGIYCPSGSVTRAEMAVFLVRAFHLP
jgi:hypothetical protein